MANYKPTAGSGLSIANIATRTSSSQDTQVTITPTTVDISNVYLEAAPANIEIVEFSGDDGTTFFDPTANIVPIEAMKVNAAMYGTLILNSGTVWRYTCAASAGTYIVIRMGYTLS